MSEDWQRSIAVILLAALGGGILWFMIVAISSDGKFGLDDGGWLAAAFLSLREVMSKVEKIALGVRTPAPPLEVDDA